MRDSGVGGRGWSTWGAILFVALASSSCGRPKPVVVPDLGPDLGVPVVPARVLASLPEPEAAEEPPETPPEASAAPARRPRPRPLRTDPPPKPDVPPDTTVTPVVEPPAPAVGAGLRTVETRDDEGATRRVRETLGRATATLGKVSPGALGREARTQYDMAQRFIAQADEALRVKNFMLAGYLAGKAETIARELAR